MSEEDKIKEKLHQIFPSPEVANAVVDIVVHNRPQGWGRKSNAPYYAEKYARQIQKSIDAMIANGTELVFKYKVWCGEEGELMSENTLYNRINQSIRYLVEKMDTHDRKYGKWYETVRTMRKHKIGVVIGYIPGFDSMAELKGEEIRPLSTMPQWRMQFEDWVEGDSVRPFCVEGLMLTTEEIQQLKNECAGLSNVQVSIKPGSFKAIKISQ